MEAIFGDVPAGDQQNDFTQQTTETVDASQTSNEYSPSEPEATETDPSPGGVEDQPEASGSEGEPTPTDASQAATPVKDGDVVKFLREQAKTDPASTRLMNHLRDNYFRAQEFTKLYPDINQARQIKTHLDAIGGLHGLNELQTISNDMSELYQQFDSGDPTVIDDIAQQSRDGFLKIMPHALETLYRVDSSSYNSLIQPILANTILNSPLVDSIALTVDRLNRGETDAAVRELQRIVGMFENLKTTARGVPQAATNPPNSPPPQDSVAQATVSQVRSHVEPYLERTIRTDATTMLKGHNLNEQALARVTSLARTEIDRILGEDKNYVARVNALMRQGNVERTRQFIQSNVDLVRSRVVRQLASEFYPNQPNQPNTQVRRAAAPAQKPTIQGGMVMLQRAPKSTDIDWGKTSTTNFIAHTAVLADGRTVRWPYPKG